MNNSDKASLMNVRAYDMFPTKHKECELVEKPFSMYSYERPSTMFWQAIIEEMFDRGLNEEQVEELLCSKKMRHMLDDADGKFKKLAKSLVTNYIISSVS